MRGLEGDISGGCFNYSSYTINQPPLVREVGSGPVAIAVASSSNFAFLCYRSEIGGSEALVSFPIHITPKYSFSEVVRSVANSTVRITSIAAKVGPDDSSLCVEMGSLNGLRKLFCQILPLQVTESGFSSSNDTTSVNLVILPDSKTACTVFSKPYVIIECRAIADGTLSILPYQRSIQGSVSKMAMTRSGDLIAVASYNDITPMGDFFYYNTSTGLPITGGGTLVKPTKTDSIFTLDDKYVQLFIEPS